MRLAFTVMKNHDPVASWGVLSQWVAVLVISFGVDSALASNRFLTPEVVQELALSKGLVARSAELEAQRANALLAEAKSEFDLLLTFTSGYGQSLNEATATLSEEATFGSGLDLEKKLQSTGTLLSFTAGNQAGSLGRTFSQNIYSLGIRQPTLRNSFGVADRFLVESAELGRKRADLVRDEAMEASVLQAMVLYWTAHVSRDQLKENEGTLAKYEKLVRNARERKTFALVTPGELPRLQAEFESAKQRAENARLQYVNSLGILKVYLQIPREEEVEIQLNSDLPQLPEIKVQDHSELRVVRSLQSEVEQREKELLQVKSQNRSSLDFVARTASTEQGVADGRSGYYVGLEFSAPLGSDVYQARIEDAEVRKKLAETTTELRAKQVAEELAALSRELTTQRKIAESATSAVKLREKVVQEIETAYRQGRQSLVELIRAYNDLSNSELERARAFGQLQILLNRYLAAHDQLLTSE